MWHIAARIILPLRLPLSFKGETAGKREVPYLI